MSNHAYFNTISRFIKLRVHFFTIPLKMVSPFHDAYRMCNCIKLIQKEKDDLREVFESVQLQEYHSKTTHLVGEEKVGRLAELLKSRFLIARPVNIFLQAITNQFLYCLIKRDKETSKQIFQLILEQE